MVKRKRPSPTSLGAEDGRQGPRQFRPDESCSTDGTTRRECPELGQRLESLGSLTCLTMPPRLRTRVASCVMNDICVARSSPVADVVYGDEAQSVTVVNAVGAAHQITTRSVTGRLAKKPCKDVSAPLSPSKKQVKGTVEASLPEVKIRKKWAPWTVEEKNQFLEAILEHGKDFDAIQYVLAQKQRRRGPETISNQKTSKRRDNDKDSDVNKEKLVKTKDQIRHCYYRTWHTIARYIDMTGVDDAHKHALELFALISYGEFRKKNIKITEKIGQRLNELVHKGVATLKEKGKHYRFKIPPCRAVRKLFNMEDGRDESKLKMPDMLTLELAPRTNAAWSRVQSLSLNPRLRLSLQPDRPLASVIDFLSIKWKSRVTQIRESVGSDGSNDNQELRIYLPPGQTLKPLEALPARGQIKENFSFDSYLESVKFAASVQTTPPTNKRTKSLLLLKTDDPTLRLTDIPSGCPAPENSVSINVDLTSPLRPGDLLRQNGSSELAARRFSINNNRSDFTEMMNDDSECARMGTLITPSMTSSETAHSWPSLVENRSFFQQINVETVVSSTVGTPVVVRVSSDTPLGSEQLLLSTSQPLSSVTPSELCSSPQSDRTPPDVILAKDALIADKINQIRSVGFIDLKLGQNVTMMELYVMMSRPTVVTLEYDWVSTTPSVDVVELLLNKTLSNRLRRLIDIATTEFVGNRRSLSFSSANSSPNSFAASNSNPNLRQSDSSGLSMQSTKILRGTGRVQCRGGGSRRDVGRTGTAAEASLDQSANIAWLNVRSSTGTLSLSSSLQSFSSATAVTYSRLPALTNVVQQANTLFRVPTSLPPKSQVLLSKSGTERTIIDQQTFDNMNINIFNKHPDLLNMRKLRTTRQLRRPVPVQRVLLPKNDVDDKQSRRVGTLSMVPGLSSSRSCGSFLPVSITDTAVIPFTRTDSTFMSQFSASIASSVAQELGGGFVGGELSSTGKSALVTVTAGETKPATVRRITPIPLRDSSTGPTQFFGAVSSNSFMSSAQPSSIISRGGNNLPLPASTVSASSSLSISKKITGIDAFLLGEGSQSSCDNSAHNKLTNMASSTGDNMSHSAGDSNLSSLLDLSLPPIGGDGDGNFSDLSNSNSSFAGLLSSVNPSSHTLMKSKSTAQAASPLKPFRSVNKDSLRSDEAWMHDEEFNLSNFLPDSPLKSTTTSSISQHAGPMSSATVVHSSLLHPFASDNSRDSILGKLDVETTFQCMLTENSLDYSAKFADLAAQINSTTTSGRAERSLHRSASTATTSVDL